MEVATDRTLEVYETLAALDERERGEVLTWIADYVESKAKAEPTRGLYLVPPHGELIAKGEKTSIAKSRRFDIEGDWVLVSGKLAYGTMTLGEPSEVGLEKFDEQFDEHRVEKAERRRWWPDKKTLWLYAIESFKPYPEPRKVEVPPGVQTTMDRVEFEGQKQVESALKVRIAQTQAEAEKGFSARDDIALDEGLILPLRCDQGLWMRDTRVPLKAAFLDGDYKVLEVIDLKPLSEDVRMPPQGTAYALEARPSWFEMVGLEAGDVVVPQRAKAVGTRADILLEKLNDLPEKFVWIPDFVSLTGSQVYAKNREPNDTDIVLRAQDLDDRFYVVDKEADLQVPVDGSFALKLERLLIDKLGTKRVQYTNNAYGPGWSSAPLYDLCLVKREPLTLVDIGRREPAFAEMEYKGLKGGPGSGHHGHAGRPGEVGGSVPSGEPSGEFKHERLPSRLLNELDGGGGAALQYHGTSNRETTFDKPDLVYLTLNADEARGYARDLHRLGLPPSGGAKKRQILLLRRKPGRVLSIAGEIDKEIAEGGDVDALIKRKAASARKQGFRYLYYSHPSFVNDPRGQDVFISLYPDEDLKLKNTYSVRENPRKELEDIGSSEDHFLSESEKAVYLTEFDRDGKRWVGPDIDADSFDEAEEKAGDALEVMGELVAGFELKGGPGSGHHGHAGRPGKVGGSAANEGALITDPSAFGKEKLYHLTRPENTESILKEGLRPSSKGYLGAGIYLVDDPKYLTDPRFENASRVIVKIKKDAPLLRVKDSPNLPLAIMKELYGRKKANEIWDGLSSSQKYTPEGKENWSFFQDLAKKAGYHGLEITGSSIPKNIVVFDASDVGVEEVEAEAGKSLTRPALDRMLRGASAEIKKQAKATYDENSVKPGRMVLSLKPLRPAPAGERQTIDVFYAYIEEHLDFPLHVSAKRDGATIYAHGDGKRVWLFSDDGEDRTEQLPTIAAALKENFKSKSFVMGCEIEKWVDGKHYPREAAIGDVKKGEDEDLACNIFRLIYYDGEDLHEEPFSEIWKTMQKLPVDSKSDGALRPRKNGPINLVPHYEVNSLSALKSKVESTAYKPGVEGVVVKRADGDFPLRGEPDTSNPQEIKYHKSVAAQVVALASIESRTPGVFSTWFGIPIE